MGKFKKTTTLLIVALLTFTLSASAQLKSFGYFVTTGPDDAQELMQSYLSPYLSGFGASLTGGWYNTAKPHKLGGFDITATINTAMVPVSHRTFNPYDLALTNLAVADGSEASSPTIAGEKDPGPALNFNYAGFSAPAFNLPGGTNFPYVPSPMLQLGVGLMKGTEVMGRYMPRVKLGDSQLGLWGIGLKHDIKQWIPAISKLPVLNLSVMGGYTKLDVTAGMDVTPQDVNLEGYINEPAATWENQKFLFSTTSFTTNLLVSANLPIVCFYGGIGITNTKSNVKLQGNYPMIMSIELDGPVVEAVQDPIDMEISNKEGSVTKPRINTGVRFKFGVIALHFDYTRSTYNVFSGGLGITFR